MVETYKGKAFVVWFHDGSGYTCSYILFGREHVCVILKDISIFKSSKSKDPTRTSFDLHVISTHNNSFHILYLYFVGLSVLDVYDGKSFILYRI
jgi:hypothetical protein